MFLKRRFSNSSKIFKRLIFFLPSSKSQKIHCVQSGRRKMLQNLYRQVFNMKSDKIIQAEKDRERLRRFLHTLSVIQDITG